MWQSGHFGFFGCIGVEDDNQCFQPWWPGYGLLLTRLLTFDGQSQHCNMCRAVSIMTFFRQETHCVDRNKENRFMTKTKAQAFCEDVRL